MKNFKFNFDSNNNILMVGQSGHQMMFGPGYFADAGKIINGRRATVLNILFKMVNDAKKYFASRIDNSDYCQVCLSKISYGRCSHDQDHN